MQVKDLLLLHPGMPTDNAGDVPAAQPSAVQRAELTASLALRHAALQAQCALHSEDSLAPRVATIAFLAELGEQAGVRCSEHYGSEQELQLQQGRQDSTDSRLEVSAESAAAARRAGGILLARMLHIVERDERMLFEAYFKGDTTHRFKLRAWQALCVLAPFMDAQQHDSMLGSLLPIMQRADVASVKQYQERCAPLQPVLMRC